MSEPRFRVPKELRERVMTGVRGMQILSAEVAKLTDEMSELKQRVARLERRIEDDTVVIQRRPGWVKLV